MKPDMRADNTFIFNVMESRALFNWVPVTTVWRVVMLRLGETECRYAVAISRQEVVLQLGVGRGANKD